MSALAHLMPPPPRRILRLGPWRLETAAPAALLLPAFERWMQARAPRTRESLLHYLNRYGPPECACTIPRDELPAGHYRTLGAVSARRLDDMRLALRGQLLTRAPGAELLARALRQAAVQDAGFDPEAYPFSLQEKAALKGMLDALYGCRDAREALHASHDALTLLWCDRATRLPCKMRLDGRHGGAGPWALIPTAARSRRELLRLLPAWGWGRRAAFALEGSRAKTFFLTAVQQAPPHQVWTLPLHANCTLIREGRQELGFLLRCIREAGWPLLPELLEEGALEGC